MFQLSRVVIVRIQSNDTSRGLESTNRVAAAGTQGTTHESTTRVSSSLVCSLSLSSAKQRPRVYTRILNYTRGLDTVSLHERPPPISAARSSIPRKRRAFHSQLICVYLQTSRSHERKGKINFCIVEEPCRRN